MRFTIVYLTLIIAQVISGLSIAGDINYKFCSIAGFYMGSKDEFLGGLALNKMVKDNLYSNSVCTAVYKEAYSVGEYLSIHGKVRNQADSEILNSAGEFKTRVQNSILTDAGY